MNLQRYKITNLLTYQVTQVKKLLSDDSVTVVQNRDQPHFADIYVGLNPTEFGILSDLGYSLLKFIPVGDSVIL